MLVGDGREGAVMMLTVCYVWKNNTNDRSEVTDGPSCSEVASMGSPSLLSCSVGEGRVGKEC